jgi:hypothetical protein
LWIRFGFGGRLTTFKAPLVSFWGAYAPLLVARESVSPSFFLSFRFSSLVTPLMCFLRQFSLESKSVQLVVEEGSTGLWMREKCKGVIHSIFLNRRDCFWFLEALEEMLTASTNFDFWRRSRFVFLVSLSNVVSIGMGVSWLWRTLGVARGGDPFLFRKAEVEKDGTPSPWSSRLW